MEQGLEILGATAIEDKLQVVSPLTKLKIMTPPPPNQSQLAQPTWCRPPSPFLYV
jgi:hypothetical protein